MWVLACMGRVKAAVWSCAGRRAGRNPCVPVAAHIVLQLGALAGVDAGVEDAAVLIAIQGASLELG